LIPSRRPFFTGDAGRAFMVRGELAAEAGEDTARADEVRALDLLEEGLSYNPLYGKNLHTWRSDLLSRRKAAQSQSGNAPLEGSLLNLSDEKGPYAFSSEIVHFKSSDGADIEATLLVPEESAPQKPGLVFVHMWARDRNTWWGLPELLASHGYSSIYMDLRGHGKSRFPDSAHRVTIKDEEPWMRRYVEFPRDVIPAIDLLSARESVKEGKVVVLGASLGCPVGVLAAEKRRDKVLALVMLSPSVNYFGVDCREALPALGGAPFFVMLEKSDASFKLGKEFFSLIKGYKTYLELDHIGHGTDALYREVGLPTILLSWLEQLKSIEQPLRKIDGSHPLLPLKKK
jgi:pimeloyl-ACP methyl ester carboxylesterase